LKQKKKSNFDEKQFETHSQTPPKYSVGQHFFCISFSFSNKYIIELAHVPQLPPLLLSSYAP
jgi:hypothetical protein